MLLSISFHYNFLPILIVVFVAWVTPFLMATLHIKRIPTVIIEIIFGYLASLGFKDYFNPADLEILNFLALSGFIFLMFLSGLEIDVDAIEASLPRKKITLSGFLANPLLVGLSHFALVIVLALAGTKLLSLMIDIPNTWYYSLILLTTSVGIIYPVLKNRGELQSRYGQMIITAAAVADIFSIILCTSTIKTCIYLIHLLLGFCELQNSWICFTSRGFTSSSFLVKRGDTLQSIF